MLLDFLTIKILMTTVLFMLNVLRKHRPLNTHKKPELVFILFLIYKTYLLKHFKKLPVIFKYYIPKNIKNIPSIYFHFSLIRGSKLGPS